MNSLKSHLGLISDDFCLNYDYTNYQQIPGAQFGVQ